MALSHPARVAIDGVDAAAKTALADELAGPLGARGRRVIRASIDGFHNPCAVRYRRGPDSPGGYYLDSFDHDALRASLLDPLGSGGDLRYRTATFDYRTESRAEPREQLAPAASPSATPSTSSPGWVRRARLGPPTTTRASGEGNTHTMAVRALGIQRVRIIHAL